MEEVSPVPLPGLSHWVVILALAGSGPSGVFALPSALLGALFAAAPSPSSAPYATEVFDDPALKPADDPTAPARNRMVDRHLVERGIKDPRVLDAFRTVPRHRFVPAEHRRLAYEDESLPIGEGQTITPTYDVAFMTEALQPKPTDTIFEVGTGSGYQAAILSRLVKDVYSVEIHQRLGEGAAKVLKELGYDNVHTRVGDGYAGWPDAAPFDAVIVTCAPEKIPAPLVEQLKDGGRLLIPLGDRYNQAVWLFHKKDGKLDAGKKLKPTLFVPMTGRAQQEAAEERSKQP
jgi:protein-L-isoaspartate(D-aspartate) O-methyltransferase